MGPSSRVTTVASEASRSDGQTTRHRVAAQGSCGRKSQVRQGAPAWSACSRRRRTSRTISPSVGTLRSIRPWGQASGGSCGRPRLRRVERQTRGCDGFMGSSGSKLPIDGRKTVECPPSAVRRLGPAAHRAALNAMPGSRIRSDLRLRGDHLGAIDVCELSHPRRLCSDLARHPESSTHGVPNRTS